MVPAMLRRLRRRRNGTGPVPQLDDEQLGALRCPGCRGDDALEPEGDALVCRGCASRWPFVDGILDMVVERTTRDTRPYRPERLDDAMASSYDVALPLMSATVWRCPPLRFVDWAHMAVGRAQGGLHLSLPVATGRLLSHVWADYLDVRVIAADRSWKMLRHAQRQLDRAGVPALLVRADVDRLPFRDHAFASILSLNGLHAFDERTQALHELWRVLDAGGTLAGSTLVRNRGRIADTVLDAYERFGVSPMLRGKDYLLAELNETCTGGHVLHESYGAVLFFAVEASPPPPGVAAPGAFG